LAAFGGGIQHKEAYRAARHVIFIHVHTVDYGPLIKRQLASTQLTLGPDVVQIRSHHPPDLEFSQEDEYREAPLVIFIHVPILVYTFGIHPPASHIPPTTLLPSPALRLERLPTETTVESGTSQSKSATSVSLCNSGFQVEASRQTHTTSHPLFKSANRTIDSR